MARLRNIDYTDREMLFVIARVADENGIASSLDIANALDIGRNGKLSPAGRVAARLSWMRRYGFVERVDPKSVNRPTQPSLWIMTAVGAQMIRGQLKKSLIEAIDKNDVGTQLLIMRRLLQASHMVGSPSVDAAVRREYLHNAEQIR